MNNTISLGDIISDDLDPTYGNGFVTWRTMRVVGVDGDNLECENYGYLPCTFWTSIRQVNAVLCGGEWVKYPMEG